LLVNSNRQTSIVDSTLATLYLLQSPEFDNLKRTLLLVFGVRNNLPTFFHVFVFNSTGQEAILDSKLATLYLENEVA